MNTLEKLAKRDDVMTAAEVAKILGVTTQHIYKLAALNEIPCFHVGRRSQVLAARDRPIRQRSDRATQATTEHQKQSPLLEEKAWQLTCPKIARLYPAEARTAPGRQSTESTRPLNTFNTFIIFNPFQSFSIP